METLGSVTYACVDKTGTLTQNRMRVENTVPAETPGEATLLRAMALNNDVVVDPSGAAAGEGTELALYEHAAAHGALKADLLRAAPRVAEAAFDSERKRMSTVHREDGGFALYCKGAPETLSPRLVAHDGR